MGITVSENKVEVLGKTPCTSPAVVCEHVLEEDIPQESL